MINECYNIHAFGVGEENIREHEEDTHMHVCDMKTPHKKASTKIPNLSTYKNPLLDVDSRIKQW